MGVELATTDPIACIVSPNAADASLAVEFLERTGIGARPLSSLSAAASALDESIGALVLVEDSLLEDEIPTLNDALQRLPAWSDLPLVLIAADVGGLGAFVASAFPGSGNVTLLERPLNAHTFVSAVQVALRASSRQRQVGELIAQRELDVKLREEFLAMLAHELRNPLAPMRNALYIMRMRKIEDPIVIKNTDILERQVNHVVRLVDDLMDVARLERGKVMLKRERSDLNRVVSAAVENSRPHIHSRGHTLKLALCEEALPIDADIVRIEQIVTNLINNAAKFSPPPDRIEVETAQDGATAVITVRDHGIGFDAHLADELFSPFLQAESTLERSAGGLGIGLTIVRRLVELHGGNVRATSEGRGTGARFTVRLPLATAAAGSEPAVPSCADVARRRRVVVIEDNADIRDTLGAILSLWGHEVSTAGDGPSGLQCVLNKHPEVALIDVGLPGMDGYDVARAIRSGLDDGIRLIAITGYGQPADRQLALQAGFDRHLLKPISPEVLQQLLAEP